MYGNLPRATDVFRYRATRQGTQIVQSGTYMRYMKWVNSNLLCTVLVEETVARIPHAICNKSTAPEHVAAVIHVGCTAKEDNDSLTTQTEQNHPYILYIWQPWSGAYSQSVMW